MATSGSTDFTLNRDEIISGALRVLGVLSTGETASPNEITDGSEALNLIIKELQADGIGLWLNLEVTVTLVADTYSYTLGPTAGTTTDPTTISRPMSILEARYVDSDDIETPLVEMSRNDYMALSDKDSSGRPTGFYYDKKLTDGVMYLWPAPDTADSVKLTSKEVVEDFDATANNADFPPEWLRPLKFLLAKDLALEFGITGQKLIEVNAYAREAYDRVLEFDSEDTSTFIGVDYSGAGSYRRSY